jgi:hypothetical protein
VASFAAVDSKQVFFDFCSIHRLPPPLLFVAWWAENEPKDDSEAQT